MHDFWRSSGWHLGERTAAPQLRLGDEPLHGWRRAAHFLDDPADMLVNPPLASRT